MEGQPPLQILVGHAAFVPFSGVSPDGSQAEVSVGIHRYELRPHAHKQGLLLRDTPALDWRQMLGDRVSRSIAEPLVEFQLFETGESRSGVLTGVGLWVKLLSVGCIC